MLKILEKNNHYYSVEIPGKSFAFFYCLVFYLHNKSSCTCTCVFFYYLNTTKGLSVAYKFQLLGFSLFCCTVLEVGLTTSTMNDIWPFLLYSSNNELIVLCHFILGSNTSSQRMGTWFGGVAKSNNTLQQRGYSWSTSRR